MSGKREVTSGKRQGARGKGQESMGQLYAPSSIVCPLTSLADSPGRARRRSPWPARARRLGPGELRLSWLGQADLCRPPSGFTLLELMLAVSLLALVMTVTYMTFSTVTTAWKRGIVLSENIDHGDFIMEQLVMGLSSAYYPDVKGESPKYGFWLDNKGGDEYSGDIISWVKLGTALVGEKCDFAEVPHRVMVSLESDENGEEAVAVRAWRLYGQPEDFDPMDVPPFFLSTRVAGFNCEARDPDPELKDEIAWTDEWEKTNRLPTHVSLTLYLEPVDEDEEAVELRRIATISTAPLSWR